MQKGFEKYNETRDLNETKKAVIDTCVERYTLSFVFLCQTSINFIFKFSAGDIAKSLPGIGLAQTGTGIAKDLLYDGKDVASTIANRYKKDF